ncbi:MAG: hypothetical protein HRF50_15025 [Phycisphaerae bacterium]|jgi:hypothetical protein
MTPPNPSKTSAARSRLRGLLARWGAQRSTREALAWTLLAVAGTLAFALVIAVLDHVIDGGLPAPLVSLVAPAGAIVFAAALILRVAWRREWNPVFLAREYERLHEVRHNPVLNAAALAAEERYPAPLIDAAAAQAERTIAETPPRQPVSRPLRLSAWLVATALLAWLLFALLTPKPVLVSLGRMVGMPWPAPTATQIELVRPVAGEGVYRSEPLTLEFRVTGRRPPAVSVEIAPPDADPSQPPLRRMAEAIADDPDRWRALLAPHEVTDDLSFRCTAGDARLSGVIQTRPQPREMELAIRVEPPPHAGPPYDVDAQQPLVVWAESKATFRFRSNTRIREPILVLQGADTTRTRMAVSAGDPAAADITLPLRAGGEFWVEFTDVWGHAAGEPIRRTLVVHHDQPPTIEIAEPPTEDQTESEHALARTPWLEVAASDDLSLTNLSLVAESADGVRRIPLLDAPRDATPRARERVPTSRVAPPPGGSVRLWFEASDNHADASGRPAPQTARSEVLVLTNRADTAGGLDQTAIVGEAGAEREQNSGASAADAHAGGDGGGGRHASDANETGGDVEADSDGDAEANSDGTRAGGQPPDPNEPVDAGMDGGHGAGEGAGESGAANGAESASAGEAGDEASRGREPSHGGEGDVGGDGGRDPSQGGEGEVAPDPSGKGKQDAQREFEDELRRFAREFGRDAREVVDADSGRDRDTPSRDREGAGTGGDPSGDSATRENPGAGPKEVHGDADAGEGTDSRDAALQLLERDEPLTDADLAELGWSDARREQFAGALRRLRDAAARAGIGAGGRSWTWSPRAEGEVTGPAGLSPELVVNGDRAARFESLLRAITPPPEQRISPALRAVLDAYYRAMAASAAPESQPSPP